MLGVAAQEELDCVLVLELDVELVLVEELLPEVVAAVEAAAAVLAAPAAIPAPRPRKAAALITPAAVRARAAA